MNDFQSNSFIPPTINPPTPYYYYHLPFMIPKGEPFPLWFVVYEDVLQDPTKVVPFTLEDVAEIKTRINILRPDIPVSEMKLWKVRSYRLLRGPEANSALIGQHSNICLPSYPRGEEGFH